MKTILVPVDFSATAANAAEFAGNLAAFYNAEIWLYHSYESVASVAGAAFSINGEQMQLEKEQEMNEFKSEVRSRLKFPIDIHTRTELNLFQEGLDNFCNEIKPDIVVMGLSGKTGITKLFVRSNTVKAVHYLNYPVLVIPPKASFVPVRKIGFACNYDKVLQNTPIGILEKIILDFNVELHVINVHSHYKGYKAQEIMEGIFASELLRKFKPEYHTIESENIAAGINSFADNASLDWVVAIPKKHNLADKLFKHSHTKDLLHHTHVPVLCVHE